MGIKEKKMTDNRYAEIFSRNIGIVTEEEQEKLKNTRVAIAGTGGAGSNTLYNLVRSGVCNFSIAEPDAYQYSDMNRQFGSSVDTIGRNKAEVLSEIMPALNPAVHVRAFPEGLSEENIDTFLEGADVVIDAIEYFFTGIHRVLMSKARKKGLYVFFPPAFGFGTTLAVFSPEGPTYDEFYGEPPQKMNFEYIMNFGQKLFPIVPDYIHAEEFVKAMQGKRPIPTFAPTVLLAAVNTAIDVILLILNKQKPICVPQIKWVDMYERKIEIINTDTHKWSPETKKRLALA